MANLFHAVLGHAEEMSVDQAKVEVKDLLIDGEVVEKGFKFFRDMIIFTNKRLIFVNKQGFTGNKMDRRSIPWKTVTGFSAENAGTFDLDEELKIWVRGLEFPITINFAKGTSILQIQREIASKVL
ncbi:MAG: PH domain-containing protein [Candidatus Pacebacteria bacterium]|nr:PH domain-containing protein [Candidatus Paceibacterota bacterium]